MKVSRPALRPSAVDKRDAMEQLQHEIASLATFSETDVDPTSEGLRIAGVDQAFGGETATSAVVVMDDGEVVETTTATVQTTTPYIPGLLSFREGEAIIAALSRLEERPDVVLVDGNGRIHYREAGLATHIGVIFDIPTVGIAKGLLCGRPRGNIDDLATGERVPIEASDEMMTAPGTVVGYAVQTRQYDSQTRHINPLYVSAGHRVTGSVGADLVERTAIRYKLPEPVRAADSLAGASAE